MEDLRSRQKTPPGSRPVTDLLASPSIWISFLPGILAVVGWALLGVVGVRLLRNRRGSSSEGAAADDEDGDLRRELLARVVETEEMERKRMAHELVDDPAQVLAAGLLQLQLALRRIQALDSGRDREELSAYLDAAQVDLLDALDGVRRIARGLHPPELDDLGVIQAVAALTRRLSRDSGVPVVMEMDGCEVGTASGGGLSAGRPEPSLSAEAALALYRVVQEAVHNALFHGAPGRITVRIQCAAPSVRVTIEDDGRGFEPDTVRSQPQRYLGILRMLERVRHARGTLDIRSAPGEGTSVDMVLPTSPTPSPTPVGGFPTPRPGTPPTEVAARPR